MIAVKIRRDYDAQAAALTEVCDVAEIDVLRRSLVAWGIVDVDDPDAALAGQWVVESGQAYFEFIVIEDE